MSSLYLTSPTTFWALIFLPPISYWLSGFVFLLVEWSGQFEKYRLHTPVIQQKRNRVTRTEAVRRILAIQLMHTLFTVMLELTKWGDKPETFSYETQLGVNAHQSLMFRHGFSWMLAGLGLNTSKLAQSFSATGPTFSYMLHEILNPEFAITQFDMMIAKALYWVLIPVLQFTTAFVIGDLWQYISHRAFHEIPFLYKHVHAPHHKLDVPYCFAASYETYSEAFITETVGSTLSLQLGQLSPLQSMAFIIYSTVKASYDHCGYQFPYDPFRLLVTTNPIYHDIHHQRWGSRYNYSQTYFTFWDDVFGTKMSNEKAKALYARADASNGPWVLEKID